MLCVHSPGGSTYIMVAILNYDIMSEIRLLQSTLIYLKNSQAPNFILIRFEMTEP